MMNEKNRRQRGHDFLPDWDQLTAIPLLYATEDVRSRTRSSTCTFFVGACDWYIAEIDDDSLPTANTRRTPSGITCRCLSWRRCGWGRES